MRKYKQSQTQQVTVGLVSLLYLCIYLLSCAASSSQGLSLSVCVGIQYVVEKEQVWSPRFPSGYIKAAARQSSLNAGLGHLILLNQSNGSLLCLRATCVCACGYPLEIVMSMAVL